VSAQVSWRCDGPECDTWANVGTLTEDWIVVYPGPGKPKHFCDGWCAMRWFAAWAEPAVEVPLLGGDGG
jgi:hypothetical protein